MRPESTLAELCLFAHPTLNTVLFGDRWRWKPLIIGRQLQSRAAGLVDGWPERGRGVGDGGVGTVVERGVGH